jgi:hypothetical protein
MHERVADLSIDVHVAVNAGSPAGVAAVARFGLWARGAVGRIDRIGFTASRGLGQQRDGRAEDVPVPGATPGVA